MGFSALLWLVYVATPAPAQTKPEPIGNFQTLFTTEDYPTDALRHNQSGPVMYELSVGTDGAVDKCTVTQSSGVASLDEVTCTLLQRRARFAPARDATGEPVAGTYRGRMTWQIPDAAAFSAYNVVIDFDVDTDGVVSNCVARDLIHGADVSPVCVQMAQSATQHALKPPRPQHIRMRNSMEVEDKLPAAAPH